MKRTKIKKLVLTDGTWYYENRSVMDSMFTDNPRKAWNFYTDRDFEYANEKRQLHWELDMLTKNKPLLVSDEKDRNGKHIVVNDDSFKIENCKLKWITIIETIKEEDFNYEGFKNTDFSRCGEEYEKNVLVK